MPADQTLLEIELDEQVDQLLADEPFAHTSDPDLRALLGAAARLSSLAAATPTAPAATRRKVWDRVAHNKGTSKLRAIAFYRLPYLPPLWIRPEAS